MLVNFVHIFFDLFMTFKLYRRRVACFECCLRDYYWTAIIRAVFSGGAGGARAPPEFGGSGKGRSLISAFWSLAITTNTPGFEKLNTALFGYPILKNMNKMTILNFSHYLEKLRIIDVVKAKTIWKAEKPKWSRLKIF